MKSISYLNSLNIALLILFNAIMVFRITKICLDGMTDDDFPTKKRVMNCVKAMMVVNCIDGLIAIIKRYYM